MPTFKWTPVRKRIITFLQRKKRFLTAKDILSFDPSLDKVTVYRTLETFEQAGFVRALFLATGERAYEFIDENDHHHHFRCRHCQEIYHLPGDFNRWLEPWQRMTGFQFYSFEMQGICRKCLSYGVKN